MNAQTSQGEAPIHVAIRKDHTPIFLALINNAACKLDIANIDGYQPIHLLAESKEVDIAMLIALVKKGVDLMARTNDGASPLMVALESRNFVAADLLRRFGAH